MAQAQAVEVVTQEVTRQSKATAAVLAQELSQVDLVQVAAAAVLMLATAAAAVVATVVVVQATLVLAQQTLVAAAAAVVTTSTMDISRSMVATVEAA